MHADPELATRNMTGKNFELYHAHTVNKNMHAPSQT
jgi:hypothetical protein